MLDLGAYRLSGESDLSTLIAEDLNNGFAPLTGSNGYIDLVMLPTENLLYASYGGGIALFQVNDLLALEAVAVSTLNRLVYG